MTLNIPVVAFSAWSGTGKTTIIEQLVRQFKAAGIRTAVVKHDAHDFEIDREGKDSWKFSEAGADMVILSSDRKTVIMEQRHLELKEVLAAVHDVDIIFVEGYNDSILPRIGISRIATGTGFRLPVSEYIAVITDEVPIPDSDDGQRVSEPEIPTFALDDIEGIAAFIRARFIKTE